MKLDSYNVAAFLGGMLWAILVEYLNLPFKQGVILSLSGGAVIGTAIGVIRVINQKPNDVSN